jgi:hypothetical protein
VAVLRFYGAMKIGMGAACMAALFLSAMPPSQAAPIHIVPHRIFHRTIRPGVPHLGSPSVLPAGPEHPARPWVEGVTPPLENRLFDATYRTLPSHNILKVYVFDTKAYESAGIRLSARVPHEVRNLGRAEMSHEAVSLIRTTFDKFPELQTLDVWATIPVPKSELTQIENTVFSVSADRDTYLSIRDKQLSDPEFLAAFGRVWIAPEIPQ